MAINWGGVEAFTRDMVEPTIQDQIFETSPLLTILKAKAPKEKTGKKVRVLVQYAKNTGAGSYSGADLLPTVRNEKFADTELDWRQSQSGPIVLNGDEEFKNSGPEEIADLVQAEIQNAKESIRDEIAEQLYTNGTGNASKDVTGLIAAVDDGTTINTYAGIARLTYTWWKSGLHNWSATPITLNALHIVNQARTDGGIRPDYVISNDDFYNKMYELILPSQRQYNDQMGQAGFTNLRVDGRTLVVDGYCGATDAWVLNSKYLDLIMAKGRNFVLEPFQKPVNQDARITRILWAGQFVDRSCRRHARIKLYDITI